MDKKIQITHWHHQVVFCVFALATIYYLGTVQIPGPLTLERHGWPANLDLRNLRKFHSLESLIPINQRVIVLAKYHNIASENWVVPEPSIVPFLAFGRNPYIFNIQLGAGHSFDFRDLRDNICGSSDARTRFLREKDIKWLLLNFDQPQDVDKGNPFCGLQLKDFGIVTPPLMVEGLSLAFLKIEPDKIDANDSQSNKKPEL